MDTDQFERIKFDNSNTDEINQLIELAEAEYKKILDDEEDELNTSCDSSTDSTLEEKRKESSTVEDAMVKLREHILKTKVELVAVEEQSLNEIFDSDNSMGTDFKTCTKIKCNICHTICTGAFDLKIHERVHHQEKGMF